MCVMKKEWKYKDQILMKIMNIPKLIRLKRGYSIHMIQFLMLNCRLANKNIRLIRTLFFQPSKMKSMIR
ncbi:hypothetical protein C443_16271 [Haloarcula argentinensis DSM 12282]|nr:hypothetical protein C443_16271 [Haloarcula argentinensis DSM 12282]